MNIKIILFENKVSYLIVDEADEDLEMAEDPFLEEELPGVLSEEPGLNVVKNEIRGSKRSNISHAASNASEIALEITNNCKSTEYHP